MSTDQQETTDPLSEAVEAAYEADLGLSRAGAEIIAGIVVGVVATHYEQKGAEGERERIREALKEQEETRRTREAEARAVGDTEQAVRWARSANSIQQSAFAALSQKETDHEPA